MITPPPEAPVAPTLPGSATRWDTTNLVGVPAGVLGGTAFNARPAPLHIAGAREAHGGLFELLQRCATAAEARVVFAHYMSMAFGPQRLPRQAGEPPADGPRRWHTSYLRLLQGWGLDANGAAGAVLKGWVESRFGLAPIFHGCVLAHFPSPAWTRYLEQKGASRWQNNHIHEQLDVLYEFCQWMLERFALAGPGMHVTLWRGSQDCEQQLVRGSLRERRCTLRLNNVVSFSRERDTADCFGDWVLQAQVPVVKLLLVPGLLDSGSLQGEAEVLALGGEYEVVASYGP